MNFLQQVIIASFSLKERIHWVQVHMILSETYPRIHTTNIFYTFSRNPIIFGSKRKTVNLYQSQFYWRIAVFLNLYLVNWSPRIYCDPELILCTLTFLSRRCVSCFSIPLKITIICLSLNNFPFSKKLTTTLIFHSGIPRNAKRI